MLNPLVVGLSVALVLHAQVVDLAAALVDQVLILARGCSACETGEGSLVVHTVVVDLVVDLVVEVADLVVGLVDHSPELMARRHSTPPSYYGSKACGCLGH